ncbi:MAG TPA: ATP-dependent DNA helicase RecQ [Longimicrobiaceae bacterium]
MTDPLQRLRETFGWDGFRPGQREVLAALEEHGAALAVFPTGGGKSLCYQLPALDYPGVTVVISPLIALMKDQIDQLRARGVAAARLDSTLTLDEAREISSALREGRLKLLYVAPERFNNERFLEQLGRTRISLFAVDEAHCISEWGHNFRPDYLKLARTARELGAERVLALTATATPEVVADICQSFGIPREAAVVTGFHRPNLFLRTAPTPAAAREAALRARLGERPPGSTIVYVTHQATATRLAEVLADAGVPARPYHAGMDDEVRAEVQEWWKASERGVVVATIAFGMGIDKADVRYVYHYNLPKGLESYSQEIGRAGRDGLPSTVEMLGDREDVRALENFAYGDTPDRAALQGLLRELLGNGEELELNLYALGRDHDIRPHVLRTALTYLELLGVLRQGTPFHAGYRLRPRIPLAELIGRLPASRRSFVERLFAAAKQGRIWLTIDPEAVAAAIGEERARVVAALDYFAEQGWVDLEASDVRHRFSRLVDDADVEALVEELAGRFEEREAREIQRIGHVLALVALDGCQTAALLEYFGEELPEECGHCGWCADRRPAALPELPPPEPIDRRVDAAELVRLRREHGRALGSPRQCARFLCGLSSPALGQARLGRHALAGALADRGFREVLHWCEARLEPAPAAAQPNAGA